MSRDQSPSATTSKKSGEYNVKRFWQDTFIKVEFGSSFIINRLVKVVKLIAGIELVQYYAKQKQPGCKKVRGQSEAAML